MDQRAQLKDLIDTSIDEVEEEIEQLKELTQPIAPDNAYGRVSRMDAINNKTINEASLRENKKKLQKLERAQRRIREDEDFGKCAKCGEEIPFGRLEFMPWTTKCVKCA
jgi:DnaK suppressor protein